jgi:hypothetical protein
MEVHAYIPSIQEAEAGVSWVQAQSGVNSDFEVSLDYIITKLCDGRVGDVIVVDIY